VSRRPLRDRIPAALALAPMTAQVLARCLGTTPATVRNQIAPLRESGEVVATERAQGANGHPWNVYELPA
jgi:predicted ArsR family transcriptional regulator